MEVFMKPNESYTRDFSIGRSYIKDLAKYISLMSGSSFDHALDWVRKEVRTGGKIPMISPPTAVLVRQPNGDRKLVETTFDQFMADVQANGEMLTPSLTAYMSPARKRSRQAVHIDKNLKRRSAAKKEMQAAKMRGDLVLEGIKSGEQTSLKTANNSLSGAQSSQGTPLFNKSAHSSLTSICRTATSYANAWNERFLAGSRHYWAPEIAKSNICSILNNTDMEAVKAVAARWDLRPPTLEQYRELMFKATDNYWRNDKETKDLEFMYVNMSDEERMAFAFTGDCYYLRMANPEFFRTFLTRLTALKVDLVSEEMADKAIKEMHPNTLSFVSTICMDQLAGGTIWDCDGKQTPLKTGRYNDYIVVGSVAANVDTVLQEYRDFIDLYWLNKNFPASIFMMGSKVREVVMLSDTDSTVFTVSDWTHWITGNRKTCYENSVVNAAMVYLTGQTIRHVLATVSGNMGVYVEEIKRLSMKNEFTFPALSLTSRAKHYAALISACEGNIYKKLDEEIKGVGLRGAKVPPELIKAAAALFVDLLEMAMKDEQCSIYDLIERVSKVESDLKKQILSGSTQYARRVTIKQEKTYANPLSSNFLHYSLWEDVFAPKYGGTTEPPYVAVKASLRVDRSTRMKEWLASLEDRALAGRMETWMAKYGRRDLTMILVPELVIAETGIPKEIVAATDVNTMLVELMESFYIILESCGIFLVNKNNDKLISEMLVEKVQDLTTTV